MATSSGASPTAAEAAPAAGAAAKRRRAAAKSGAVVALICARGGSKGLPRKNIIEFMGRPLIAHTILAARDAEQARADSAAPCRIVGVWVSSDCAEIRAVAEQWGAQTIARPADLATDTAGVLPSIEHACGVIAGSGVAFDHIMLLQATSPLRKAQHVTEALSLYTESTLPCLTSVMECAHPPHKAMREHPEEGLVAAFGAEMLHRNRQELPQCVHPNGAIYITPREHFLRTHSLSLPGLAYRMSREASVDIDAPIDLHIAKAVCEYRGAVAVAAGLKAGAGADGAA